jgi:membrane associated rhomboid family serine protease
VTEPAPPAPVCYRHPDRPTWIRCARCDRPICPEDMIPAPVGFQCPECVAAAQAATREPKTVFGGKLTSSSTVTLSLIGISAAVFVLQFLTGVSQVASQWGMWPAAVAVNSEWYRLLTSVFLHGSWLHLAFNMYVLYVLGPPLERLLGHVRFLALYLIAGLGGAVASFTFSAINTVSVGASGAIFGLMGALVVAGRHLRADITQVLVLIGINVVIGFLAPGIDWRAHLGGLVVGAAVAFVLSKAPTGRNQTLVQVVGCAGIVLILAGIALYRAAQIQELIPVG